MGYAEAIRLTGVLVRDPTSQVATALLGWDAPRSFEWLLLADLFDVYGAAHFKKPLTYPRPYPDPNVRQSGNTDLSRAEVIAILNAHGHNLPPEGEDTHG